MKIVINGDGGKVITDSVGGVLIIDGKPQEQPRIIVDGNWATGAKGRLIIDGVPT